MKLAAYDHVEKALSAKLRKYYKQLDEANVGQRRDSELWPHRGDRQSTS